MMLPKRRIIVTPQPLQVGGTSLLGQTVSTVIDRTYPLEEILIHVDIQMSSTGLTAVNPDQIYGILSNATLNINDGV